MTPADSPYLPDGRQWAWDSTSLGLAKDCKRKYYYSQILGWRHKNDSVHLVFGGHYAAAMQHYHQLRAQNHDHEAAVRDVIAFILKATWDSEAGVPWRPDHNFKTRETLIRSLVWYFEEFKDDPCKTIILADGKPAVELSYRLQISDEIFLCGHLDRLVEYSGGTFVQDQKTTGATLGAYYFKRYNPDNQMSGYTFAAKVGWKTPVKGVIIDAAQIAVGFTRFARGLTYRTESQLTEWLNDAQYHIRETWRAAEAGWPMNDSACQKYGGCPFLDICAHSAEVREDFLKTDFEKRHWNPLEVR